MPDRRRHRGAHPQDARLFAPEQLSVLRPAAADLAWLLSRDYPAKAALKLVGDRHALRERQRDAIQRATVGDRACERRRAGEVEPAAVAGRELTIDGYNVLLTVETALGGGVVLAGRDGTWRDMAAMRGHYKRVDETRAALVLAGAELARLGCARVRWLLDRPISNSGRLRQLMLETAAEAGWEWEVELAAGVDRELVASGESGAVVASADGWVLDAGVAWLNLARRVIETAVPGAWVVDLFDE